MDFKIGDVVTLNSFSRRMVISEVFINTCKCMWFDKKDRLHQKEILKQLLVKENSLIGFPALMSSFELAKSYPISNKIETIDLTHISGSTKPFLIHVLTKNDICISPSHRLINEETKLNNAFPPTFDTNSIRGKIIHPGESTLFIDNSSAVSSTALNSYVEFLLQSSYPLKYVVLLR